MMGSITTRAANMNPSSPPGLCILKAVLRSRFACSSGITVEAQGEYQPPHQYKVLHGERVGIICPSSFGEKIIDFVCNWT